MDEAKLGRELKDVIAKISAMSPDPNSIDGTDDLIIITVNAYYLNYKHCKNGSRSFEFCYCFIRIYLVFLIITFSISIPNHCPSLLLLIGSSSVRMSIDDRESTKLVLEVVAVAEDNGLKLPREFGLLLKQVKKLFLSHFYRIVVFLIMFTSYGIL